MSDKIKDSDLIEVCDSCKRACCWQGIFYCDEARNAGTTRLTVADLKRLDLEHPSYWKETLVYKEGDNQ